VYRSRIRGPYVRFCERDEAVTPHPTRYDGGQRAGPQPQTSKGATHCHALYKSAARQTDAPLSWVVNTTHGVNLPLQISGKQIAAGYLVNKQLSGDH
ncbi:MAG: hypothetical protein M3H12_20325, partial [Chromatiales bacterium]